MLAPVGMSITSLFNMVAAQCHLTTFKRTIMKFTHIALILAASVLATGCSSLTQSDSQSLSLTATYQGKPVESDCKLTNDRGSWDAKSPANVMVRKSNEDLNVVCKKEGLPDGLLKAISRAAGSMFGNIILGGGIGAMIDHSNGRGYDYPIQLPVKMGESVVADKRADAERTQNPAKP